MQLPNMMTNKKYVEHISNVENHALFTVKFPYSILRNISMPMINGVITTNICETTMSIDIDLFELLM